MSFGATKLLSASGSKDAYEIDQSLMFDRGDTAYLVRAAADITDGNHTTFTYSTWFKRVQTGSNDIVFNVRASNGAGVTFMVYIPGTEQALYVFQKDSGGNTLWYLETNRKLRDVGAWYHIVVAVDTTQGTAGNRVKIYINGTQETSFTGSSSYPDEDLVTPVNDGVDHQIGYNAAASLDGYMAETYLIDGTAQAASAFGKTDAVTGAWIPKKYGGAFGNNGFYLKYVSGAIGTDSSGEGNNYTATNLANADVVLDTPTNNYPTINSLLPLDTTLVKLYQGNLRTYGGAQSGGNGQANSYCTFNVPSSGKWYVESYVGIGQGTAGGNIGAIGVIESTFVIPNTAASMFSQSGFTGMTMDTYSNAAKLYDGGSAVATVTGLTATEYVVALAIDVDNGKVYVGYDSGSGITWLNSGNPAGDSNGTAHTFSTDTVIGVHLSVDGGSPANTADLRLNFGQNGTFNGGKTAGGNTDSEDKGNFFYSVPSGFKALCTKNLPDPTIKKSTDHFNTVLYTGNGSTQSINGVGHQPDLVWIKNRSATDNHKWTDVVRGVTKEIESNSNDAEATNADGLTAFGSDGFSLGDDDEYNTNTENYVSWNWKAGNSSASNEDGSINTTATSVSTDAGFSVSTYTGTGSTATVGHGLGVVPSVIIIKNRGVADDWAVYSRGDATDYLELNTNNATADDNAYWNDTAPTSSVFTIGTAHSVNASSETYVAYCFANVEGFFKSGTYTGNGAAEDGPFVYTGFSPSLVIIKETSDSGGSWFMWDNKREVGNVKDAVVWADTTNAETSHAEYEIDVLSNGFKLRGNSAASNQSGQTMLYMAWAESPFKYANAR